MRKNSNATRVFLIMGLALAISNSATAQNNALTQLQGSWTTYFWRLPEGVFRVNLDVSNDSWIEEANMNVKTPMFPRDSLDLKWVAKVVDVKKMTIPQGVYQVTLEVNELWQRFNSTTETHKRNREAYCNWTNWQAGIYHNVIGIACNTDGDDPNGEIFEVGRDELYYRYLRIAGDQIHMTIDIESSADKEQRPPANQPMPQDQIEKYIDKIHPFYKKP